MERKQTPGAAVPGHRTVLILLAFVILAVLRTSIGISEHAHAPIGDESNRLQGAYQLFRARKWSKSVYDDCYIWVFKHVTADPIEASFKLREAASILSTAGIFLLFCSIPRVGAPGAFVTALIWNMNLINTPIVQKQASTVFAFGLACLLVAARCRYSNRWVKLFYVPAAMLIGFVRPEYHLLWLLYVPFELARVRWRDLKRIERWAAGVTIFFFVAVIGSACANRQAREAAAGFFDKMDRYVYLGFSDRYSQFYVAAHPEAAFDPMVEHGAFMARTFHGAHGLSGAIRDNPSEVLRFVARNTLYNLQTLPGLLEEHSILLPGADSVSAGRVAGFFLAAGHWLLIAWVGFGAFWLTREVLKKGAGLERSFLLLSLAAVSSVSLLLLIPRARYWITFIPLLFCGSAAFTSRLASRLPGSAQAVLGAALFVCCSYPVFFYAGPDYAQKLICELHAKVDEFVRRPSYSESRRVVLLGFYTRPLAAMTNPDELVPMDLLALDGEPDFPRAMASTGADFLVLDDSLRKSRFYAKHGGFFAAFAAAPGQFGYEEVIQAPHFNGTVVYEKSPAAAENSKTKP